MEDVSGTGRGGLFGGLFARGAACTGDEAWLQAMLDTEAALARALERAGLAPAGAGAAVTAAARPGAFDVGELGRRAANAGNPVPALGRALTALVPPEAAAAVHQGASSQDIIDTAVMLIARRVLDAVLADLAAAAGAAAALAEAHRDTIMIGRTLLQQGGPGDVRPGRGRLADRHRRGEAGPGPDPRPAARGAVRRRGGHAGVAGRGRVPGAGAAGRGARPGPAGAALAYRPAADGRAGLGAHRSERRSGQDRERRHAARPAGAGRGARGRGRAGRR
jgi:hypothetical protein